jgi:4-amino-4-deoxy-L-arabinose transferase-like glycosyltransferase
MLESRDFVVPRLNGQPRLQKPPLTYWLAAAGYIVSRDTSEGAGRLYSAAAGAAGVLLVFAYGCFIGRSQAGFWAAMILATSRLWLRHARLAETDVLLSLGIAAALLAFLVAFDQTSGAGRRIWVLAGWTGIAVACLAKGPAGLLVLPAALVCGLAHRGRSSLRVVFNPIGLLVFLIVVTPWFLLVTLRDEVAPSVFWHETAVIASGSVHGQALLYSAVYYLLRVWPDFGPWSVLLPLAVPAAMRAFRTDSLARCSILWATAMFLQLEVVGSRQPHYLLPAIPGLALLVGWWLAERARPFWRRLVAGLLPLPVAVSLFLAFGGDRTVQPEHFARKDFALAIGPMVRGRPLSIYGKADPILCFYLKRTIPEATIESLRQRLTSEESVLVLVTVDYRDTGTTIKEALPGSQIQILARQKLKEHEAVFLYRLSRRTS